MQDISNQEKIEKKGIKRKATTSRCTSKAKKNKTNIIEIDSEQEIEIEEYNIMLKIEIKECKMQLVEKQTADHRAQAEIQKLELKNIKLHKELDLDV